MKEPSELSPADVTLQATQLAEQRAIRESAEIPPPPDRAILDRLRLLSQPSDNPETNRSNQALRAELRDLIKDLPVPLCEQLCSYVIDAGLVPRPMEQNLLSNSIGVKDCGWPKARQHLRRVIYRRIVMHALPAGVFDQSKSQTAPPTPPPSTLPRWVDRLTPLMLILLPGLPIVALVLALTHHTHSATIVVAWWTIFCAVLAARALQVRARDKKRRLAEMQTRLREGIRKRAWYDFEVPRAAWDPAWNTSRNKWTDWVEGELRTLLPTDTVLAWAWRTGPRCGAGGYAIERFGRIIAEARTWDPEAPLC